MADWNSEPAALLESGWPEKFGAEVIVPDSTSLTCTSGTGRFLDYGLVSLEGRNFVESIVIDDSFCLKPPFGLRTTFVEVAAEILMRVLVPFSFPALAPLKKGEAKKKAPQEEPQEEP